MHNHVQQNWGVGRNLAPTERRIDPLTYITSSLVMGALVFMAVLWLLWRPIPLLGLPRGSFSEHGLFAIKFLIHAAFPHRLATDAIWYKTFWSQQSIADVVCAGLRLAIALAAAIVPAILNARTYLRPGRS